jgi:hypothetical protein
MEVAVMRCGSRLIITGMFLLTGAMCFSTVSCLPNGDQLRSIIQGSMLGGVQAAIQGVIQQVIPPIPTTINLT